MHTWCLDSPIMGMARPTFMWAAYSKNKIVFNALQNVKILNIKHHLRPSADLLQLGDIGAEHPHGIDDYTFLPKSYCWVFDCILSFTIRDEDEKLPDIGPGPLGGAEVLRHKFQGIPSERGFSNVSHLVYCIRNFTLGYVFVELKLFLIDVAELNDTNLHPICPNLRFSHQVFHKSFHFDEVFYTARTMHQKHNVSFHFSAGCMGESKMFTRVGFMQKKNIKSEQENPKHK